jgi:hypothetical protein
MKNDDMIAKIAALKAKVPERGATEDEAMAALAIAEKLMEKHGITEADLQSVEFSRDMRAGSFTQKQKTVHPAHKYCAVSIGVFCGVKVWTGQVEVYENKKHAKMFGLKNDVEMAEFLLGLIHDSMDRGWKEFLSLNVKSSQSRHVQYWSFMLGFSERVNDTLKKLIDARTSQVDSTGNELVEVKMALVMQGMESMLPDVHLRKTKTKGQKVNLDAYGQGQLAGDKVNLSRPITRQQSNVKRIA